MQNKMKALVIFLVCLSGMAGTAFFMKVLNHEACWFCSTSDYFKRGVEFACSGDEAKRKKALDYLIRAADEGYAPAAMLLSELYAGTLPQDIRPTDADTLQCLSDSVSPDGVQARKYLDQASELYDALAEGQERVDPDLAFRFAMMYLSPPFSEHDDVSSYRAADVALKLLNAAAEGGNPDAMLKFAAIEESKGNGDKAVEWYSMAAEKRQDYRLSLRIGDIYLYGKGGVPLDHKKALEWYNKAQAQAQDASKDMGPEEREHLLDTLSVRIDLAGRKIAQGGGKNSVTVNYLLAGNGGHYLVMVRDEGAEAVTVGEVIRTDKGIRALVAADVQLPEDIEREKEGFESMNQGMEWVLRQWAVSKYGKQGQFIFRLAE